MISSQVCLLVVKDMVRCMVSCDGSVICLNMVSNDGIWICYCSTEGIMPLLPNKSFNRYYCDIIL